MSKYSKPESRKDDRTKHFVNYCVANVKVWPEGIKAMASCKRSRRGFKNITEREHYKSLSESGWTICMRKMYFDKILENNMMIKEQANEH